jgi:hypothetical protein
MDQPAPNRRGSRAQRRAIPLALAMLCVALAVVVAPLGDGPNAGAAPAVVCTQDWRPAAVPAYLTPAGTPTDPPRLLPPPPTPEHRPFHVFCGGHYVSTVWLGPRVTPIEAVRMARELVAAAAYPSARPAVNPGRGLTGLASWFWVVPDPSPVLMVAGNGPRVDLELRVQTVRWRFGDGTPGSTEGLGTAYPSPSPVRHVYERKGSYTVEAQVVIAGRYWFEELFDNLPPGSHTVALRHDVAELRSLLHAR